MDYDMRRPQAFSISIKGVVVRDGKVLLLRNERKEWELPGGRIEVGETPRSALQGRSSKKRDVKSRLAQSSTPGCTISTLPKSIFLS